MSPSSCLAALMLMLVHVVKSQLDVSSNVTAANTTVYDCEQFHNVTIPKNVTSDSPRYIYVLDKKSGVLISWNPPANKSAVKSYTIKYLDGGMWKVLNKEVIDGSSPFYASSSLIWGHTYTVRVLANLADGSCTSSMVAEFTVRMTALIGIVVACILLTIAIAVLVFYIVRITTRQHPVVVIRRRRSATRSSQTQQQQEQRPTQQQSEQQQRPAEQEQQQQQQEQQSGEPTSYQQQ